MGLIVPISLLAYITEAISVSLQTAFASDSTVTPPMLVHIQPFEQKTVFFFQLNRRLAHGGMLGLGGQDPLSRLFAAPSSHRAGRDYPLRNRPM
jgi:hypothetical protein